MTDTGGKVERERDIKRKRLYEKREREREREIGETGRNWLCNASLPSGFQLSA